MTVFILIALVTGIGILVNLPWLLIRAAAGMGSPIANYWAGCLSEGRPGHPEISIRYYRRALDLGFYPALVRLGQLLIDGTRSDALEAEALLTKAWEHGWSDAVFSLGNFYRVGYAGTVDERRAFYLFKRAAELGVAGAQLALGTYYQDGVVVELDRSKAFDHFLLAAKQGIALAQAAVGHAYQDGKGAPEDHMEALRWFRKAAKGGCVEAYSNLYRMGPFKLRLTYYLYRLKALLRPRPETIEAVAYCLATGHGVRRNPDAARAWYEKAVQAGSPSAAVGLGQWFERDGSDSAREQALAAYEVGAARGSVNAMIALARLHSSGPEPDPSAVVGWLEKAIKAGSLDAMRKLGNLFLDGPTPPADPQRGWALLIQAAEAGNVRAQSEVGFRLVTGKGIDKDPTTATKWLERAAEGGDATAQYNLAESLETGAAGQVNLQQALFWYRLSSTQVSDALPAIRRLEEKLPKNIRAEIQARILRWLDVHGYKFDRGSMAAFLLKSP